MMDFPRVKLVKTIFIYAVIWSQIYVNDARVRYEEFDTSPNVNYRLCIANRKSSNQLVDNTNCRKFCKTETDFLTGGCDCVTLKCVCADVALNFCDFQNIRQTI